MLSRTAVSRPISGGKEATCTGSRWEGGAEFERARVGWRHRWCQALFDCHAKCMLLDPLSLTQQSFHSTSDQAIGGGVVLANQWMTNKVHLIDVGQGSQAGRVLVTYDVDDLRRTSLSGHKGTQPWTYRFMFSASFWLSLSFQSVTFCYSFAIACCAVYLSIVEIPS